MLITLTRLKLEIRSHALVKNSILGHTKIWKTTHYNTLSNIITEELIRSPRLQGNMKYEIGNSISGMTLKRIFEDLISESASRDLRFLKTLDKISIFLNYDNFNDFISKKPRKGLPVTISQYKADDNLNYFKRLILDSSQNQFDAFTDVQNTKLEDLKLEEQIIIPSPYHSRIINLINVLKKNTISISRNLKSNFEIFNTGMLEKNDHLVVISTSEFWNLHFIDINGKDIHYHVKNDQNYFFKMDQSNWKIWDNYNPEFWAFMEKI